MKKWLSVKTLANKQFKEIMDRVSKRKDVPLVKIKQVSIRVTLNTVFLAKHFARKAKKPMTTFLAELIAEVLQRMWKVTE